MKFTVCVCFYRKICENKFKNFGVMANINFFINFGQKNKPLKNYKRPEKNFIFRFLHYPANKRDFKFLNLI